MNFADQIAEFLNSLVFDFIEAIVGLVASLSESLASAFSGKARLQ